MAQLVCRKMIVQTAVHCRICALMLIYASNCRQRWRLRGPPGYRILLRNDAIHFEKILPITFSSVVRAITNVSYLGIYVTSINVRSLWNRLLRPVVLVIIMVLHNSGASLLINLVWVPPRACESILLLLVRCMMCIVRLCCILRVNRILDWIPLHHLLLLWAWSSLLLILVELTRKYLARWHRGSNLILFVWHRCCYS